MTDPAQARLDELADDRRERLIRAALIADGYDPPPHEGQEWWDPNPTNLPAGHREIVTIMSIGKTVSGWQTTVRRRQVDADGRTVESGCGEGRIHLDHLLTGYGGMFQPYRPLN